MLQNNYTQQQYKSHHVIIPASGQIGSLLLGDLNAATDQEVIQKYNIKTIITAACGLDHLKIPSELTHVVFPLMDTKQENIQSYFELSYRTIQQNLKKGSVLVHCGAGISRSASLIIAFYMKKFNSSFKNAINHMKRIKPNVCPNLGFQLQLKNYQSQLGLIQNQPITTLTKKPVQMPSTHRHLVSDKNSDLIPSSPFLFNMPQVRQAIKPHSKAMNKTFNRTYGGSKSINKEQKSGLFIQGKSNNEKSINFQKSYSHYQPQKYMRSKDNWGTSTTAKKQTRFSHKY